MSSNICINSTKTDKTTYNTGSVSITVKKQKYSDSSLFIRYDHDLSSSLTKENIIFCIDKSCKKKFTVKLSDEHLTEGLLNVEVYFNKYDDELERPLIIILYFSDDRKAGPKCYKYSDFIGLTNSNVSIPITKLNDYNNEYVTQKLLKDLLTENDNVSELFTYQVDKITNNNENYNSNKIRVTKNENELGPGFTKYTHNPVGSNNKKACVLYNNNVLFSGDIGQYSVYNIIEQIQNKEFENVNVYWSNKLNIPLMVAFSIKGSSKNQNLYYIHKKKASNLYWEQLKDSNLGGYISTRLTGDVHTQLSGFNRQSLIEVLQKIEVNLCNRVVLLIEKMVTYEKDKVEHGIRAVTKNLYVQNLTDVQPNNIEVSKENCLELEKHGYICYCHSFYPKGPINSGELVLLMPNLTNGGKYSEIKITRNGDFTSQNENYLVYKKSGSSKVTMLVFFYSSDTRPLLFRFGDKAYRATSKNNYDQYKWEIVDIGTSPPNSINNPKLIDALSDVVGFLNEVNIYDINGHYQVHSFEGKPVHINVKTGSNVGCYKVYSHSPPENGYRLGSIKYQDSDSRAHPLNYDVKNELVNVTVYYYKNDSSRKHPLLVKLEFKGSNSEQWHKLNNVENTYSWSVLESSDLDGPDKLLNKLYELNKQFNQDGNIDGNSECKSSHENDSTWEAIGATTGTIGAVGGIGFGIFKYNAQLLTFLKTLF